MVELLTGVLSRNNVRFTDAVGFGGFVPDTVSDAPSSVGVRGGVQGMIARREGVWVHGRAAVEGVRGVVRAEQGRDQGEAGESAVREGQAEASERITDVNTNTRLHKILNHVLPA